MRKLLLLSVCLSACAPVQLPARVFADDLSRYHIERGPQFLRDGISLNEQTELMRRERPYIWANAVADAPGQCSISVLMADGAAFYLCADPSGRQFGDVKCVDPKWPIPIFEGGDYHGVFINGCGRRTR